MVCSTTFLEYVLEMNEVFDARGTFDMAGLP